MDGKRITVKSAGVIPVHCEGLIYTAIAPILRLSRIVGLSPLVIKNSSNSITISKSSISTIYSLVLMIVLIFLFILSLSELQEYQKNVQKLNSVSIWSSWGQIYAVFCVSMIALLTGIYYRDLVEKIFQRIAGIDRQFCHLGILVSYHGCQKQLFIQLLILLIIPSGASMCLCAMISGVFMAGVKTKLGLCYWFICFSPILLITMKEFQYYNLIRLVKKKINILNR